MIFENQKISIRQLQALFISEVFATAIVFMPAVAWKMQGGKSILAGGIAILALLICAWIISMLYKKEEGFGALIKNSFGRPLGNVLLFAFWLKIVIVSGIWLKEFSQTIHSTMLDSVPYQFIAAVIAVVCFYLAQKDMEVRGRTGEIFIVIMALLFIPVLIIVAVGADYTNMLPLKGFELNDTAKTAFVIFASLGSADYLWFLYPKTDMGNGRWEISKAIGIVGLLLIATMIVVFSVFGPAIAEKSWPVLRMMDTVDFPGAFIERQDVLMMGFWILSFYIYISGGITYGTYILKEITGKTSYMVTGILIFVVSAFKFPVTMSAGEIMLITTPLFLFIVPVVLLLVRKVRQLI